MTRIRNEKTNMTIKKMLNPSMNYVSRLTSNLLKNQSSEWMAVFYRLIYKEFFLIKSSWIYFFIEIKTSEKVVKYFTVLYNNIKEIT